MEREMDVERKREKDREGDTDSIQTDKRILYLHEKNISPALHGQSSSPQTQTISQRTRVQISCVASGW